MTAGAAENETPGIAGTPFPALARLRWLEEELQAKLDLPRRLAAEGIRRLNCAERGGVERVRDDSGEARGDRVDCAGRSSWIYSRHASNQQRRIEKGELKTMN